MNRVLAVLCRLLGHPLEWDYHVTGDIVVDRGLVRPHTGRPVREAGRLACRCGQQAVQWVGR
jgi:hypothetical protein